MESNNRVERIEVDSGVREVLPRDRNKAVVHVAAKVFRMFSLLQWELMEVLVQIDAGELLQHMMTEWEALSEIVQ